MKDIERREGYSRAHSQVCQKPLGQELGKFKRIFYVVEVHSSISQGWLVSRFVVKGRMED